MAQLVALYFENDRIHISQFQSSELFKIAYLYLVLTSIGSDPTVPSNSAFAELESY